MKKSFQSTAWIAWTFTLISGWTLAKASMTFWRAAASAAVPMMAMLRLLSPRPGMSAPVRRGHDAAVTPTIPAPRAVRALLRVNSRKAPLVPDM
ncbi:hypothetical protein D3C73_1447820 [compost metagenome]